MRNVIVFLLGMIFGLLVATAPPMPKANAQMRVVFEPTGDANIGWSCPNNSIAVEPFHGMIHDGATTQFPTPVGHLSFLTQATSGMATVTEQYEVEPNSMTKPVCISR